MVPAGFRARSREHEGTLAWGGREDVCVTRWLGAVLGARTSGMSLSPWVRLKVSLLLRLLKTCLMRFVSCTKFSLS